MTDEFASALTTLWELAGSPTLDAVKGTSKSSFSDWKNGHVVPDKSQRLEAVVLNLRLKAREREKAGSLTPQDASLLAALGVDHMESLRQRAREKLTAVPGTGALVKVRGLSAQAVEDAGLLMKPNSRFPQGISLADLHVSRSLESAVLDRVPDRCGQLVVGEPGYGKTTVLWSLYHRLAEQPGTEPLFVKASFLLDALRPDSEPLPTALTVAEITDALTRCRAEAVPVLLVDTLDLLMHSPDGAALVARLVDAARHQGVSVVMSCRPGEAKLLPFEDGEEAETDARDAFLRPPLRLGAYSSDERAMAVNRHSRIYCPQAVHGPLAAQQLEQRIMGAVYQDLPMREVCDNPLTLRMLFDVYAPDPPVQDIDVASLYDQVRRQRVEQDSRAGHGDSSRPERATRDLRSTAQALARYMLAANELEVDLPVAGHHLEELLPSKPWDTLADELDELERRGVISTITGTTRVRFFHQTFFEYMAADWLRTAGRSQELVDRLLANPTDLVLAAVAGQLVPREAPGRADRLLLPLLDDDRTAPLGLELYARLRTLGTSARTARERLRDMPADPVKRFLTVLPGIRHPHPDRWVADLTAVWERGEQADADGRAVRIQLLESLCRLLRQHPAPALELLTELRCVTWLLTWSSPTLRSHDHLYLRLLRAAFPYDLDWTLGQMTSFWRHFVKDRATAGLADLMRAAAEEGALLEESASAARARRRSAAHFEGLLDDSVPDLLGMELDAVVSALGSLWAASKATVEAPERLRLALDAVAGQLGEPTHRAKLFGAGLLATHLDERGAEEFVRALFALDEPGAQTAVLDMVVVPTLADDGDGRTHGDRPRDSAFVRLIEGKCRAALRQLPAPPYRDRRRTLPRLFLEAAWRARPAPDTLLRILPEAPRDVWLNADGLAKLAVPAAASGQSQADSALHAWATDPVVHATSVSNRQAPATFATDFVEYVDAHPRLLAHPVEEALLTESTGLLVTVLDAVRTQDAADVLSHHEERLRALADTLTTSHANRRRQGYRLLRVLLQKAGWSPPGGRALAEELRSAAAPLRVAVLELVRAAVLSGSWDHAELRPLLPVLDDLATPPADGEAPPGAAERNVAAMARHVLTTAVCRLTPVEDGEAAYAALLPSILPTAPAHGPLVTEDIRELGRLIERMAPHDPGAAARLLVTVSEALHAYDPRVLKPKREIANRWTVPLRVLLEQLGGTGRKDLVLALVTRDVALARRAVEVFAQLQESSVADPPAWFRELAHRPGLSPTLRQSVGNRLRIHARTRCGGPWPELLDQRPMASSGPP
ncbi:NACHT domain-containing protein [Streptomyces sp. NPDC004673]